MNSTLHPSQPEDRSKRASALLVITLLKMYRLLWTVSPFSLMGTVACRLLLAFQSVVQLYFVSLLVNAVTQVITAGHPLREAGEIILYQLGITLAAAGIKSLDSIIMTSLKMKTKFYLDDRMAQQSSRLPLVYYDRPDYYDSFHRATASQSSMILVDGTFAVLQGIFTFTGYFLVIASFHWLLAVGLFVFAAPSFIVNTLLGRRRFVLMIFQTPTARKTQYLFSLLVGREAAKEIRLFGLAPYLMERWRSLYGENAQKEVRLERQGILINGGVESFNGLLGGAFMLGLAWLGTQGRLTIGQYVALSQAFISAKDQLLSISSSLALIYQNMLFARELFAFLELPVEEESSAPLSLQVRSVKGIEADNLAFRYPGQSVPVLRDISFHILPGQKIAIVGDNGAGKSTLVKCLLGLYTASEGAIRFDGIDIRALNPTELRKRITAVFQDYVRYQLTVRENIGFGSVERMTDDGGLELAAAKSGAHAFIEDLKDGFDSSLGPMFDGGRELSQGQWQKIAISRAYFRQADVVVLDEPTASMDPLTEAAVYENFLRMADGKTTLLISHRLGICKAVDYILVMKNGRIVERGTHEELLGLGGEYERMYNVQSQWYENSESSQRESQQLRNVIHAG
ncbi:ABC transporter ATP-binding protein [Paenibacillus sp. PR3]|uniref:ABC transporter ATP-binding protein n=1 Tax=Paenibacillus terricola TaxID=2763503 RepID=A0ABR8MVR7_9BACL|nr:ABC transporter ATP-binding protein [Paenibacillus terricola]MBD3919087.1 ABC transporter ATP-binding protein [Paenibacillus terricola]